MTVETHYILTQAVFPRNGDRYFPPAEKTSDGEIVGHSVQTVAGSSQALYELWHDLNSFPLWQENVVSVTPITDQVSHWVMGNPEDADGKRIEFDSKITEDVPGKLIAWTSITDGVDLSGSVTFQELANGRGTRVTLVQNIKLPGGSFSNAIAGIAKRSPRQFVTEDLRHFKQMAETQEIPSVKGQPHGPRGLSGSVKEWMYGETNPTPPGTSEPS
jgi:uncharacterized membrane protein